MVRSHPRTRVGQGALSVSAAIALTAMLALAVGEPARAEEPESQPAATPDPYHELETKYLFGFTTGSDIGEEGEKSVEFETTAALGKRRGSYRMIEQEFEFESVPSQFFSYELSAHVTNHSINGVEGLDQSIARSSAASRPRSAISSSGAGLARRSA